MLYFIPAWYKQNMWCENEQQWYMRRLKSEFDETIKQITLFHRNVDRPYRILVLGYSPNFRHFLHRQGMYRSKYWSCFDAIAQVRRKKVAVLSYHDIKWPKGLEFVYSPFSIIALQGDVKYAQVEFGEDGNPISIDMFEDGKICRRNYYDDRGFVSSTVIYENGIEQYQDFLMENGIWKIREYKNDGHVVVNPTCPDYDVVPDAKSGKAGEPVEIRFTKAEYDSLEAVIEEVFAKRKIKRIVNQCQKLSVESEEMNRKKSLQYDQVLQRQRDLIYATRKKLLDGASVEQEKIVEIAKENISDFVNHFDCIQSNKKHGRRRGRKKDSDKNTNTQQYTSMLNRYILDNISYKLDAGLTLSDMQSAATVSDYLMLRVYQGLSRQRERIGDEEAYEQFVREATLKAVDDGWVELIDYLEQLKYAVAGRASAQRNVMFEYQNEAFESFLDTEKEVKCNIIRNILLSDVKIGKDGRLQVIYP